MAPGSVAAALLAAGAGRRFGGGKLDAMLDGRPLGAHALTALYAAGCGQVTIVTGPVAPAFALTSDTPMLVNPDPAAGLGGSIVVAARWAAATGAESLLIALADMPRVDADHFRALIAALSDHSTGIAATHHPGGRRGVPAVFARGLFARLANLSGDGGARALIAGPPGTLALVAAPATMLADVDTPGDLARLHRDRATD